jgi:hypothetical protein
VGLFGEMANYKNEAEEVKVRLRHFAISGNERCLKNIGD